MKKKLVTSLTLVLFLFNFSLLFARETPKSMFAKMDTNQDGKVSKEEFMTFHLEFAKKAQDARFNRLDTNGDGMISREEFSAITVKEARAMGNLKFRFVDLNRDGVLTQDEVQKRFRLLKQILKDLSS
jgi:Ca2+-binding EF-hand superfamily protein